MFSENNNAKINALCTEYGVDESELKSHINMPPVIAKRRLNTNKGTFGKTLAVCGSYGMAGAAVLSLRAALKSGVGLAYGFLPDNIYEIAAISVLEAVFLPYTENLKLSDSDAEKLASKVELCDSVLFGCGVGQRKVNEQILEILFSKALCPLIIDADGINTLARRINLKCNTGKLILTPHPGEAARLLSTDIPEIERRRVYSAQRIAEKYGAVTVLKGALSIIASPDGRYLYNTTGNPGMATAGSGDVLSGIIAARTVNRSDLFEAVAESVYIHGAAGDYCIYENSEISLTASDITDALPRVFKELGERCK